MEWTSFRDEWPPLGDLEIMDGGFMIEKCYREGEALFDHSGNMMYDLWGRNLSGYQWRKVSE